MILSCKNITIYKNINIKTFFTIYLGYRHIILHYGKLINTTTTKTEKEVPGTKQIK